MDVKALSLEGMEKRANPLLEEVREISRSHEAGFLKELNEMRALQNWYAFGKIASDLRIIGIDPRLTKNDITGMLSDRQMGPQNGEWDSFVEDAARLRILGIPFDITNNDRAEIKEQIERDLNNYGRYSLDFITNVRELGFNPILATDEAKKLTESVKDEAPSPRTYFEALAALRICGLAPAVIPEAGFARAFAWIKSDSVGMDMLNLLASLTILAADEIRVGGLKGLEIIDNKPKPNLSAQTPSLPDQRNF